MFSLEGLQETGRNGDIFLGLYVFTSHILSYPLIFSNRFGDNPRVKPTQV